MANSNTKRKKSEHREATIRRFLEMGEYETNVAILDSTDAPHVSGLLLTISFIMPGVLLNSCSTSYVCPIILLCAIVCTVWQVAGSVWLGAGKGSNVIM